jgi:hypothetical protein
VREAESGRGGEVGEGELGGVEVDVTCRASGTVLRTLSSAPPHACIRPLLAGRTARTPLCITCRIYVADSEWIGSI